MVLTNRLVKKGDEDMNQDDLELQEELELAEYWRQRMIEETHSRALLDNVLFDLKRAIEPPILRALDALQGIIDRFTSKGVK